MQEDPGHRCPRLSPLTPARTVVSLASLGLGELSRVVVGSTNHWAFVAWGTREGAQVSYHPTLGSPCPITV